MIKKILPIVLVAFICFPDRLMAGAQAEEPAQTVENVASGSVLVNTLDEKLAELVTKSIQWIEAAEGFTKQQAPYIIAEILLWGKTNHTMWTFLFVSVALGFWRLRKRSLAERDGHEVTHKLYERKNSGALVFFILFCISAFIGFILLLDTISIFVAPRLYIISYLKGMV